VTDEVYNHMDDLLVKVLLGEASAAEQGQVQQWVALHPENEKYLADFRRIWEESRNLAVHSTVNEDAAWNDFRRRVGYVGGEGRRAKSPDDGRDDGPDAARTERNKSGEVADNDGARRGPIVRRMAFSSRPWLRVAAVLLLLGGGGWLYYSYQYLPAQFAVVYSEDHVVTDTLPEGTIVTLNKQSSIRYKKLLAGSTRAIELEGEAFFNVAPDKNKPFVVTANGVLIKVIGTSFNVKTGRDVKDLKTEAAKNGMDATKNVTEVIVETGRVEVTSDQHTIRLGSHEKALVPGNNRQPVKEENGDDLYNYYRTHEFVCNGLPLERLVEKLNEVYKLHVVIGDSRLRNLPLTATFQEESPDEILYVITRTLKITLVRNGKEIILK
jgi:transmembrane sensor